MNYTDRLDQLIGTYSIVASEKYPHYSLIGNWGGVPIQVSASSMEDLYKLAIKMVSLNGK
jgi:hypothetical protein